MDKDGDQLRALTAAIEKLVVDIKIERDQFSDRIDKIWGVLSDQHEINQMQFAASKILEHNLIELSSDEPRKVH